MALTIKTLAVLFFCNALILNHSFSQAHDAEILLKKDVYKLEGSKLITEKELLIAIYNRGGEQLTKFVLYEDPAMKLKKVEGYITDLYGKTVRKLAKKDIEKAQVYSYSNLATDDYYNKFYLKHNNYPYFIHVEYEYEELEFLNIAHWSPVYNAEYPTKKASLELILPSDLEVNIKENGITSEKIEAGKELHYKWESSYDSPLKWEPLCPPFTELVPSVYINSIEFVFGIQGKQDSWSNYGDWQYELIKGQQTLPSSEQKKIDEVIKNCSSIEEKISAIYHYLQDNTRYISIQLGIGGYKPFPADFVSEKKYGDCKALSNYMRAALEYADISSFYVKVYSDEDNPPLITEMPGQQFNHVMVMVPLENDSIWLECTSNTSPTGYVGTHTQNRWGLAIEEHNSKLIKTPVLKPEHVRTENTYTFQLNTAGKDKVHLKKKCKGEEYELYRYKLQYPDDDLEMDISGEAFPFSNFTIKNFESDYSDRDMAQLTFEIDIETDNVIKKYGNDYVCQIIPLQLPKFESPGKRKLPIWISYPKAQTDTLTYNTPYGLEMVHYPENFQLEEIYGNYSVKCITESDNLMVVRNFTLYPGSYSLEDYPGFYEFIQNLKKIESNNVILYK